MCDTARTKNIWSDTTWRIMRWKQLLLVIPVQRVSLMFWKYLLVKKKVDGKRPNFSLRFCCRTRGGLMLANFLIYIHDIPSSSDKLKFYLFADNTNLLSADKNLKSLESIFNAEISRVYNWLIANKLSLNIKKSNFVVSRPRQKELNRQVNLKHLTIITTRTFL